MKQQVSDGLAVAKRMVFLAWQACGGPTGMGVFQDRGPSVSEEEVWEAAYNKTDYFGGHSGPKNTVNCDYVMGRMMKFNLTWGGDFIECPDSEIRADYQSWCRKYPTFDALFEAANSSLVAPESVKV